MRRSQGIWLPDRKQAITAPDYMLANFTRLAPTSLFPQIESRTFRTGFFWHNQLHEFEGIQVNIFTWFYLGAVNFKSHTIFFSTA